MTIKKYVTFDVRQLRKLAQDATILAAAVKLYVPPEVPGLHRAAADRVLKQLTTTEHKRNRRPS